MNVTFAKETDIEIKFESAKGAQMSSLKCFENG